MSPRGAPCRPLPQATEEAARVLMSAASTRQKAGHRSSARRELARRPAAPCGHAKRNRAAAGLPVTPSWSVTWLPLFGGKRSFPIPGRARGRARGRRPQPSASLRRPAVCALCPPWPRNARPPVPQALPEGPSFDFVSFHSLCLSLVPPVNSQARVVS